MEFNDMARTLAEQQSSQLRFVAGVAHDLENPLNALKMSAALLVHRQDVGADLKARQFLERILAASGSPQPNGGGPAGSYAHRGGRLGPAHETCDLRELASEMVDLHRPAAEAHVIEIVAPEEPIIIQCDPGRISQVLTNLLDNATKYSPKGGRVLVTVLRDNGVASVTVSDRGVGIAPGERERIFEPFRRSESTKDQIPGIGLGLSVSRRIVRAHGGEIRVDSVVGEGTTFRVDLPLVMGAGTSTERPNERTPQSEGVRGPRAVQMSQPESMTPTRGLARLLRLD